LPTKEKKESHIHLENARENGNSNKITQIFIYFFSLELKIKFFAPPIP
jgi:hypothetical protein